MPQPHERLMKTRGGDELTDAARKPSDSASASGSGERLERRGAKIGGKLQRERQQNKPTGGEWQTTSIWQTEGGDGGEK